MTTSSLPAELKSFVGRSDELRRIDGLFQKGVRVVLLAGPAGVGKTRLAVRYGWLCGPAGVLFCDLTETRTLAELSAGVARAIGIPLDHAKSEADGLQKLVDVLASREPLVMVIDNAEQVVDSVNRFLDVLLAGSGVRVLVTSRHRIHHPSEHVLELGSLPREYSMALFQHRAEEAGYSGPIRKDSLEDLVDLLEGNPLAIELAAARANAMSPVDLLQRLTSGARLDLLRSPRAGDRHGSVRRAVDWSWNLLSKDEKSALTQCAVFRGGFFLDAAEALLGPAALETLQSLRDKSLLVTGVENARRKRRLFMLASIRAFALEKVSQADLRGFEERHEQFFALKAEQWITRRGAQADRIDIEIDRENLLAIIERPASRPDAVANAAVAIGLSLSVKERILLLDRCLSLDLSPRLRARVRLERGIAMIRGGRFDDAFADFEAVAKGSQISVALISQVYQAAYLSFIGEHGAAEDLCVKAIHAARAGGFIYEGVFGKLRLARICMRRRKAEVALRTIRDAIYTAEGVVRWLYPRLLLVEAEILLAMGNGFAAEQRYCDALEAAQENPCLLSEIRSSLGAFYMYESRLEEAAIQLQTSMEPWTHRANPNRLAVTLLNLGAVAHLQQVPHEALANFRRALSLLERTNAGHWLRATLGEISVVLADLDRLDEAEASMARARNTGWDLVEGVDYLSLLEGHLDVARARAATTAGRYDESARHLRSATDRLAIPGIEASGEGLFFIRRLKSTIERLSPVSAAEPILHLGPHCEWFRLGGLASVDMARRNIPRRIIAALVAARLDDPTRALSRNEVFQAGWPDQNILPEAEKHRVYVAVCNLRRMGLDSVLRTVDDGYRLEARIHMAAQAAGRSAAIRSESQ